MIAPDSSPEAQRLQPLEDFSDLIIELEQIRQYKQIPRSEVKQDPDCLDTFVRMCELVARESSITEFYREGLQKYRENNPHSVTPQIEFIRKRTDILNGLNLLTESEKKTTKRGLDDGSKVRDESQVFFRLFKRHILPEKPSSSNTTIIPQNEQKVSDPTTPIFNTEAVTPQDETWSRPKNLGRLKKNDRTNRSEINKKSKSEIANILSLTTEELYQLSEKCGGTFFHDQENTWIISTSLCDENKTPLCSTAVCRDGETNRIVEFDLYNPQNVVQNLLGKPGGCPIFHVRELIHTDDKILVRRKSLFLDSNDELEINALLARALEELTHETWKSQSEFIDIQNLVLSVLRSTKGLPLIYGKGTMRISRQHKASDIELTV